MKIIKRYSLLLLILPIVLVVSIIIPKGQVVLTLNKFHAPLYDVFFKYMSIIADAATIFVFLMIILLLKPDYRKLMIFVSAFLLESLIVILCKKVIFHGFPRPYVYFERLDLLQGLHFVEGVKIRKWNSFPSGHTAYSFVVGTYFAFMSKSKSIKVLSIVLAIMGGVSRMYLIQHFFIDVCFGASVGILSVIIIYELLHKSNKKWLDKKVFSK